MPATKGTPDQGNEVGSRFLDKSVKSRRLTSTSGGRGGLAGLSGGFQNLSKFGTSSQKIQDLVMLSEAYENLRLPSCERQ